MNLGIFIIKRKKYSNEFKIAGSIIYFRFQKNNLGFFYIYSQPIH